MMLVASAAIATTTNAQNSPLWMRHCALSPDGTTIAFTYKGDIYTVPSTGGKATPLTAHAAHDTQPVWSPDSKQIAFASARQGSMDIYIVNKEGGEPRRLTTHSGTETPVTFLSNDQLLFQATILPETDDMAFPSKQFPQVYQVSTQGGLSLIHI